MNLELLSKEQLIQAIKLYQDDLAELTKTVDILSDSNLKLLTKLNKSEKMNHEYSALYNNIKTSNKTLLDENEYLKFEIKKQRALATTACIQAKAAKIKTPCIKSNNINVNISNNVHDIKPIEKDKISSVKMYV